MSKLIKGVVLLGILVGLIVPTAVLAVDSELQGLRSTFQAAVVAYRDAAATVQAAKTAWLADKNPQTRAVVNSAIQQRLGYLAELMQAKVEIARYWEEKLPEMADGLPDLNTLENEIESLANQVAQPDIAAADLQAARVNMILLYRGIFKSMVGMIQVSVLNNEINKLGLLIDETKAAIQENSELSGEQISSLFDQGDSAMEQIQSDRDQAVQNFVAMQSGTDRDTLRNQFKTGIGFVNAARTGKANLRQIAQQILSYFEGATSQ
jgi:hypothetical protein